MSRYHQKQGVHTLGNTLGYQGPSTTNTGKLKLVHNYIAHRTAKTGGGGHHLNLTSLLKSSNILDEDGIEDLHFYFVSFNQHKNSILKM